MDVSDAIKVLTWNKWILECLGLWPLTESPTNFCFFFAIIISMCCLEYTDLVYYISDFNYVLENLTESIVISLLFFKVGLYRIHRKLIREIVLDIKNDYMKELYSTKEQEFLFLSYNTLSKTFVKCSIFVTSFTTTLYYIEPLIGHMITYRNFGYSGTDCLLVILTLHICGQISVLANEVETLNMELQSFHRGIKQIVIKHARLISLAGKLHSAFTHFLLIQILGVTLVMCMAGYNILMNYAAGQNSKLLMFIFYAFNTNVQLLGYCFIGECLISESKNLYYAFYNCHWYILPPMHVKFIIFSMMRSQTPLTLTAAKVYTFSLESFTGVVKVSMSYMSVLRSLLR